jgi:hypothetical protein
VITAIAAATVVVVLSGIILGRLLRPRGRHAALRTRRGRERLREMNRSRSHHPAATGNVVIDLRDYLPSDDEVERRLLQSTPRPSIKSTNPLQD